jgi:putative heme-binding domain-containing protein
VLQGRGQTNALPGDAARGKALFFAKAECSSCHMVRGEGGFLGPDLSTYGTSRDPGEILAAITSTQRNSDWGFKLASATTNSGQTISGIVRNEDNFSVQLQSLDGTFHLLQKSELQGLKYEDRPAMPTNYKERLTRAELDDLVSYLISAGKGSIRTPESPKEDPIEDE